MRSDVENMILEGQSPSNNFGRIELRDCKSHKTSDEECKCSDHKKIYSCNKPYPTVKVEGKNKKYASILSNDFAGVVSELTAVTQYVNHHIRTDTINESVSEALLGISIVEMKHLDIIGELILLLGEEPYYGRVKKEKFQCWTPKFINYGKDIKNIVKVNIQGEVDAIAQYKKHIEEIDDKNIKKILERIIEDEEVHIEVLDGLLKSFEK